FWDQVRTSDADPAAGGSQSAGRRRPEAEHHSVSATAQRLDQPPAEDPQAPSAAISIGGGDRERRSAARALPEARADSRVVDTNPVAESRWDRVDEDPVLVPSRSAAEQRQDLAAPGTGPQPR